MRSTLTLGLAVVASLVIAGCGGASGDVGVQGTVSGLGAGLSVTLQDNGTDPVVVDFNGNFDFPAAIVQGSSYDVEVAQQPVGQVCTVLNGQGATVAGSENTTAIGVVCGTNASVGGAVTGLTAGTSVTLLDGSTEMAIPTDGSFAFPGVQAPGTAYQVSIAVQPVGEICSLSNDTGTVQANVMAIVTVTCQPE